jgi:hypothetical protein
MSREDVTVELDRAPPDYRPDGSLSGAWALAAPLDGPVRAVELSVLWYTDGKGDEDLGVHHFERLSGDEAGAIAPGRLNRFTARLPRSPLSYDGVLVKVCWCVRVRVFWDGGEACAEAPFRLGDVAPAAADSAGE